MASRLRPELPSGSEAAEWERSSGVFGRLVRSGAALQPATVVAGPDDVAVMREVVEECRHQFGVAEDGRPLGKGRLVEARQWVDRRCAEFAEVLPRL